MTFQLKDSEEEEEEEEEERMERGDKTTTTRILQELLVEEGDLRHSRSRFLHNLTLTGSPEMQSGCTITAHIYSSLWASCRSKKPESVPRPRSPPHPTSSLHIQIWFLCIKGNHNKRGWVGDSSGGRQAESDLFPQGAVWGGVDEVLPQPACILLALSSVTGGDCHNVLHYALQRHR